MTNMYERAFVVSADYAQDADDLDGLERGDDVVVIQTTETDYHLHMRRGMTNEDVVEGLEALADVIRSDVEE